MLAESKEPFDSDDYLFEIKWDGTRTLAFIGDGDYYLINRRKLTMTERYPEFAFLADLPAGTVLDGEVVVLENGKPSFPLLMQREQAQTPLRIRAKCRELPANYIVFDMLYDRHESIMDLPLVQRRERLGQLVKACDRPPLIMSDGIVGKGKAFFEQAVARGLEGIVGKRLKSKYQPGKRTDAWVKIKRFSSYLCAIIGFIQDGENDFRSLILATNDEGELRYCGKVGSGITFKMKAKLNELLWARLRPKPIVACKLKGKWIEPGLYCRITCMERTESGEFRAPVFEELIEE